MGARRGGTFGIMLALIAAGAAAAPAPGVVASIDALHAAGERALPTDRRFLRLAADESGLRVRLRPAADLRHGRYRFRLEGVDAAWVETGWPAVHRWEALPAGPHRLHVAVSGRDGWGRPEERVVIVESPWWRTRLLLVASIAATLALAAWGSLFARGRRRRELAMRLEQARRELAEKHSEAKTRFLATLGHEIRTPLTGVLGMAELLADASLDAQQRRQVDAIQRAGRHLLRLVNDALDLARIEAGRLPLQPAPFAPRALLREVADLLAPLAAAKDLGFALVVADDVAPVLLGDATRLRQILFNLGHNAIKFCGRGEVRLDVAALAPSGLRLAVSDDGPGLDDATLARLFRRFEPGSDAGGSGGSGLGLAICRELTAAMGGTIDVDTAPGRGACFRVTLPLAPAEGAAPLPPVPARAAGVTATPRHVLLVEDDALVADVVVALLRRAGHAVAHAPHALAALAELDVDAFDLALVDLDLPGIDGLTLATLVRARWPLPMVALTARADPEAEPAAFAAGMAAFVRKPVDGATLAATMERVLGGV